MALIGATPGRPSEHLIFSKCHKMLATAGCFLKFGGIGVFDYYIIIAFSVGVRCGGLRGAIYIY